MTIFKYAFFRGLNITALIANCLLPLGLLIFAQGIFDTEDFTGMNQFGFFLVAMAIMVGSFYMAKSIQNDKMSGVLIRILAGPISMRSYLVQNFFASMIPAAVLAAAIGGIGFVMHGWDLVFAAALSLSYAMLSAASIGISFAWSCIFKNKESSAAMFTVLITLLAFVGGFMIPLSALPDVLYYGGTVLPSHWASRGITELLQNGVTGTYWLSILALLLFTTAFLLYGGKRRLI